MAQLWAGPALWALRAAQAGHRCAGWRVYASARVCGCPSVGPYGAYGAPAPQRAQARRASLPCGRQQCSAIIRKLGAGASPVRARQQTCA